MEINIIKVELMKMIKSKKLLLLFVLFIFTSFAGPVYAGTDSVSWTMQIIGLFGGLAFFLFGMELMSSGMKHAAGNQMRYILATLTENRFRGMLLGVIVTMIIQSGSATSVMLVGFVQAGLMSFAQTIGVLVGAGIGMTVTAQLIAFKVTDFALLMIAVGFLIRMNAKKQTLKNISEVLLGFGILFYGLKLMGDSMAPLKSSQEVVEFLAGLGNPVIGLIIGTVLTAIIQSSTALIGILIILGSSGMLTLEATIPMVLGANIGTCITAGFASIGTSREAKRVALANVLFRVIAVAVFIWWVPEFATFIQKIALKFGSDLARQIANVHTVFNVVAGLILLPLTSSYAKLILKIMPEKESELEYQPTTTFLDESKILSPALGIDLARSEASRMAATLEIMLKAVAVPFVTDEKKRDKLDPELSLMEGIDRREEEIDLMEEKIVGYLIRIAQIADSEEYTKISYAMVSIVKDMESIGDIVHRNIKGLITKKQGLKHDFSDEGKEELTIYHQKVCKQIRLLKEAFAEKNLEKAQKIMGKERKYLDLELQYRARHLDRLVCQKAESMETHEVHMELMNLMAQIIVYSSNIAKTFMQTQTPKKQLLL